MKYDPDIHHRRSIRLREYDYSAAGAYFVTICTQERECLFGDIVECELRLNDAGRMVEEVWSALPERFPDMALNEHVIMPNHFHGIVVINDVGAPLAAPPQRHDGAKDKGAASGAPTLGKMIRAFKSKSAIEINRILDRQGRPVWQRNYYEHVIRNDAELAAIREYILFNPVNWAEDKEYPM